MPVHFVNELEKSFIRAADPVISAKQAAYMRNQFSFIGITSPVRRILLKEVFKNWHQHYSWQEKIIITNLLWQKPEREFQYAALDLLAYAQPLPTEHTLSLFEQLIRTKSWWDTVDCTAVQLVGTVIKQYHTLLTVMDTWIVDPYNWIRRSAIICQIKSKHLTDQERLFDYCRRTMHEKDFFIRKAIGWALREYAKTNASAVKNFVRAHDATLSSLSKREATKHL